MIALFLTLLLVLASACASGDNGEMKTAPGAQPAAQQAPAESAPQPVARPVERETPPGETRNAPPEAAAPGAATPGETPPAEAAAVEQAAAQDAPSPEEQVQAATGGQLIPADAPQPPSITIPDIEKHRSQSLSYVRTFATRVPLELSPLDIEADPVLFIDKQPVSRDEFRRRGGIDR